MLRILDWRFLIWEWVLRYILGKVTGVLSAELSRLLGNRLVRVYLGLTHE